MPTNRAPINRPPRRPTVSFRTIALFEYLIRLPRPVRWTEDARNLEIEFEVALGLMPHWPHPVFDCDHDEPPHWMDDPEKLADWHRMRELRLDLDDALRERRRAARAKAPQPAPPPDLPPAA